MSFKHTQFEDSVTMRSLVKVATDKGWIKNDPLEKFASIKRNDLSPTSSLTENIIKLCDGLKSSGMNRAASELEDKFMAYKQANSLYNVSKEEGKDLVDTAHPDGGHKMENLQGDVLVETIIEKHLKMLDMINKKPNGKLATNKDILQAVKIALINNNVGKISNAQLFGLASELKGFAETIARLDPLKAQQFVLRQSRVAGKAGELAQKALQSRKFWPLVDKIRAASSAATSATSGVGAASSSLPFSGGLTASFTGLSAASIAALAAAVVAGGVAGAYTGDYIFKSLYDISTFKEAGEKVVNEANDIKNDMGEHATNIGFLSNTLKEIAKTYELINRVGEDSSVENIIKNIEQLKHLYKLMNDARRYTYNILMFAENYRDNTFLGRANVISGISDVIIVSQNFMKILDEASDKINVFLDKFSSYENNKNNDPIQLVNNSIAEVTQNIKDFNILSAKLTKPKDVEYAKKWSTYFNTTLQGITTKIKSLDGLSLDRKKTEIKTIYDNDLNKLKEQVNTNLSKLK